MPSLVSRSALMRPDRLAGSYAIIRQIEKDHPPGQTCVGAWSERTGKSVRAFCRRLTELQ